MSSFDEETVENDKTYKLIACGALLFFTVAFTLCAQASKSPDGTHSYDTFVILLVIESLKCVVFVVSEFFNCLLILFTG